MENENRAQVEYETRKLVDTGSINGEIWKEIADFPGYCISTLGRVKSSRLGHNHKNRVERILSPSIGEHGYVYATLYKDGKFSRKLVHRLVLEAFKENPNNYPECNHINEDKSDNRIENLEWCTRAYNNSYGSRGKKTSEALKPKDFGLVRLAAGRYRINDGAEIKHIGSRWKILIDCPYETLYSCHSLDGCLKWLEYHDVDNYRADLC